MRDVFGDLGIKVHHVGTDLAGIETMVNSRTRVLYVESPTNPTVRLVDVEKAAQFPAIVRAADVLLGVLREAEEDAADRVAVSA